MSERQVAGPQFNIVVIGASAGGVQVLMELIGRLPESFPVPVMVVQHLSPQHPSLLHQILGRCARMRVVRASSGELLRPGHVYVAPPRRHLEVSMSGACLLTDMEPENFCRPSANRLFCSAARRFGARTLGIVLTGLLRDGARGTAEIRAAGGVIIAQDPSTCLAPGMPRAAINAGAHFILRPSTISSAIQSLVATPGVAAMFGVGPYRRAA